MGSCGHHKGLFFPFLGGAAAFISAGQVFLEYLFYFK